MPNYKPIESIDVYELFQRPLYARELGDYVNELKRALDIAEDISSGRRSEDHIDSFVWRAVDSLYRMRKHFASEHPSWDEIQGWGIPTGLGVQLIHTDELEELVNERVRRSLATKAGRPKSDGRRLEDFDF